jgi:cardiolipin synthase
MALASFHLRSSRCIKESGVHFRYFSPFFSANSFTLAEDSIIKSSLQMLMSYGGINIANKYHGKPGKEPWLDYAVQIDDPIIAKDFNYFAETSF